MTNEMVLQENMDPWGLVIRNTSAFSEKALAKALRRKDAKKEIREPPMDADKRGYFSQKTYSRNRCHQRLSAASFPWSFSLRLSAFA